MMRDYRARAHGDEMVILIHSYNRICHCPICAGYSWAWVFFFFISLTLKENIQIGTVYAI
jgi:hypothetical protein